MRIRLSPPRPAAATAAVALAALLGLFGAAPARAQDDAIRLGMVLEPPTLDPTASAAAAVDEVVYANLFEGLTRIGPDGAVLPGLASAWEVSADGLTYRFTLREGVTFHDGTGFDAQDVVFSLNRARAEDSLNAQKTLFTGIETVTADGPNAVTITLTAPDGNLPFNLAWGDAVIVAPETADTNATAPVGTGPFRFVDRVEGDRVELARYDGYWGPAPALARATFRFVSDPNAAYAAMMAGDLDAFPNFSAPETLAQFEADPRFNVIVGTTEGETLVAMNNQSGPLAEPKVREAIARALNRADIIDGAMFGYGTPIGSHFAPHHPAYVDLTGLTPYDPDAARALLQVAGTGPLTLRLMLPPPTYARRGGEIIAAQLREVGIETEITNLEWAQWLEQVFKGHDYDLTVISHTEPMDIGIYGREDYYFGYDSPEFRRIMTDLAATADPDARAALMGQAQRRIAEDHVNAWLFQLAKTGVADARLDGLWQNAPTQANDLTAVRWTR